MRTPVRVLLALAALVLLPGCAHLFAPLAKDNGDIRNQRQQFNQLVAYRRMAGLAGLVTDDVQVISPTRVTTGKKNLVRSHEALVQKRPDLVLIFTPERVERNPRWKSAAESGHWLESWQEQGEAIEIRGSYHALWKLKNGRWQLSAQIVTPLSCKGTRYCKSQE